MVGQKITRDTPGQQVTGALLTMGSGIDEGCTGAADHLFADGTRLFECGHTATTGRKTLP